MKMPVYQTKFTALLTFDLRAWLLLKNEKEKRNRDVFKVTRVRRKFSQENRLSSVSCITLFSVSKMTRKSLGKAIIPTILSTSWNFFSWTGKSCGVAYVNTSGRRVGPGGAAEKKESSPVSVEGLVSHRRNLVCVESDIQEKWKSDPLGGSSGRRDSIVKSPVSGTRYGREE